MASPAATSALPVTTAMTPALKGRSKSPVTKPFFKPARKRSIRMHGVLSPVRRTHAEAPILSSVCRGRLSSSRSAVVMFSPSSPGSISYPTKRNAASVSRGIQMDLTQIGRSRIAPREIPVLHERSAMGVAFDAPSGDQDY